MLNEVYAGSRVMVWSAPPAVIVQWMDCWCCGIHERKVLGWPAVSLHLHFRFCSLETQLPTGWKNTVLGSVYYFNLSGLRMCIITLDRDTGASKSKWLGLPKVLLQVGNSFHPLMDRWGLWTQGNAHSKYGWQEDLAQSYFLLKLLLG